MREDFCDVRNHPEFVHQRTPGGNRPRRLESSLALLLSLLLLSRLLLGLEIVQEGSPTFWDTLVNSDQSATSHEHNDAHLFGRIRVGRKFYVARPFARFCLTELLSFSVGDEHLFAVLATEPTARMAGETRQRPLSSAFYGSIIPLAHFFAQANLDAVKIVGKVFLTDPKFAIIDRLRTQKALHLWVYLPHITVVRPRACPFALAPWVAHLDEVESRPCDIVDRSEQRVRMVTNKTTSAYHLATVPLGLFGFAFFDQWPSSGTAHDASGFV